ncbi:MULTISPECIES: flagellar assembly protein FliW [Allobacillus]|uniref:Flagellar assembly factor FliW n=1 Tax=Allobacillus salarius TaxID=1955272 RepID=A0A556PQY7_9BACI|nr:flagellar assembly protein FliW [Allobacillus salarius]TSJ66802.1 flagellar assembly protein FliW [Allobacillus salarius]
MKIQTNYFGELAIDESKIISFVNGLPGFPDEKEFVLIDLEGNPAFQVLQAVHNENLAFVVTDPFLIYKDYQFDLSDSIVEQLDIQSNEDILIRSTLTVHKPFDQSTTNLKAPLIFNQKTKKAKQIVLDDDQYTTKHPIQAQQQGGE